jgi:hypothetical protein
MSSPVLDIGICRSWRSFLQTGHTAWREDLTMLIDLEPV